MKPIEAIVNVDKFPYVCPCNQKIKTPWGDMWLTKGELSDGATGVPDLSKEAFFAHDKLYIRPIINGKRLNKLQVDLLYGLLLLRDSHTKQGWKKVNRFLRAIIRPIGLYCFPGTSWISWWIWEKHRRLEDSMTPDEYLVYIAQHYIVPKPQQWDFPSWKTIDAVRCDSGDKPASKQHREAP